MSLLKLLTGLIRGTSKVRTDRYGRQRVFGGGPRVKNGPNGGLLRARDKAGNWRRKHKFK
jgi:hypothetical protein